MCVFFHFLRVYSLLVNPCVASELGVSKRTQTKEERKTKHTEKTTSVEACNESYYKNCQGDPPNSTTAVCQDLSKLAWHKGSDRPSFSGAAAARRQEHVRSFVLGLGWACQHLAPLTLLPSDIVDFAGILGCQDTQDPCLCFFVFSSTCVN